MNDRKIRCIRYISLGGESRAVKGSDKISSLPMVSPRMLSPRTPCAIKIYVPDNMPLDQSENLIYSTTDSRTLNDLDFEIVVRKSSRWESRQELRLLDSYSFNTINTAMESQGYQFSAYLGGYVSKRKFRRWWKMTVYRCKT